MFDRTVRTALAAVTALSLAIAPVASQACTSFIIKAKDGSIVYGRTLEFGLPMQSQLIVMPRDYDYTAYGPDGAAGGGLKWKTKYGATGASALGMKIIVDGMNEKGLTGGMLYLPNLAKYQDVYHRPRPGTRSPRSRC